jgi:hypothetical protein
VFNKILGKDTYFFFRYLIFQVDDGIFVFVLN